MNKNYERCTRCNRRKLLTTGCLRKWLKPMECKHSQRNVDAKRDFNNTDITNCVLLPECKTTISTSKFVKFWKSKMVISTSVRSLQRYFRNKISGSDYMYNGTRSNEPSTSAEQKSLTARDCESRRSVVSSKHGLVKCQHSEGQLVLRGHRQHSSLESCTIYCQLSKHGWYWGGITKSEAEELLAGQDDNVFLVRDSYNSRHLLCVSFRCVGRTLHARLRHANGLFSLNNETFVPVNRISEHCANVDVTTHLFENPVRLARPLNRFAKLDTLQMVCRFAIRQAVSGEALKELPLPHNMINFLSLGSDYIVQS